MILRMRIKKQTLTCLSSATLSYQTMCCSTCLKSTKHKIKIMGRFNMKFTKMKIQLEKTILQRSAEWWLLTMNHIILMPSRLFCSVLRLMFLTSISKIELIQPTMVSKLLNSLRRITKKDTVINSYWWTAICQKWMDMLQLIWSGNL